MDLAETPWIPTLRFVLEIAATAAFALSGMIAAARQRMDAVGVCVVACEAIRRSGFYYGAACLPTAPITGPDQAGGALCAAK